MRYVSGLICSALSAFFFYAYYERYWRHDFNELGRYYDSETETVYTTSGWIWIVPALFFLLLTLRLLVFRRKCSRSKQG